MRQRRLMKAWLVTWEWDGEHAKVDNPVAAILNSRTSAERVRELVEFIYVNEAFSLSERLAYAKNKNNNPYPAKFGSIDDSHWQGQVFCGDNPFLYARPVEDLHVEDDGSPEGKLVWREQSQDKIDGIRAKIRKIKGHSNVHSA